MSGRYVKTELGRGAIRDRAQALSRPARNLLLIIDGSRLGSDWVALVHGSSDADLQQLLGSGLIAEVSAPGSVASAAQPTGAHGPTLAEVLQTMGYRQLYDLLTAQARARLGLIKGYRMILEIERCSGPEEIRALTLRFVEQLREVQGDAAARLFCLELGAEL